MLDAVCESTHMRTHTPYTEGRETCIVYMYVQYIYLVMHIYVNIIPADLYLENNSKI